MENIPVHFLPELMSDLPDLQIFRFKNTPQMPGSLPIMQLPVTPLPTDLPHRHSYCEILFFETGSGFHEIDFHTHAIQAPSVHFVAPGKVHLLTPTEDCVGYIITFPKDYSAFYGAVKLTKSTVSGHWNSEWRQPVIDLEASSYPYFRNLLENMLSDYLGGGGGKNMALASYLHIFLGKCQQLAGDSSEVQPDPANDVPTLFKELVELHYKEKHSVQEYSELLSVTADYLGKTVKRALNVTASDYILDRLLLEAKRLVVYTNLSSKEIAYQLHIEDPSYFSRMFKRKTGLSPNEYRSSMRKSATK
ncbi:helix-turn-helix domain-containing protein [Ravibacter arvi]|uniref:Helix-turn-helix domain-containing protein n=1 Tax=Ravibacter arvi TaxID=2051041 RepID=A0ABP8M3Q3_9BACT